MEREWYAEVNMCKYVALLIDTLNQNKSIGTLLNPVKKIHSILDAQNQKRALERGEQIKIEEQ